MKNKVFAILQSIKVRHHLRVLLSCLGFSSAELTLQPFQTLLIRSLPGACRRRNCVNSDMWPCAEVCNTTCQIASASRMSSNVSVMTGRGSHSANRYMATHGDLRPSQTLYNCDARGLRYSGLVCSATRSITPPIRLRPLPTYLYSEVLIGRPPPWRHSLRTMR